jgi:transposase
MDEAPEELQDQTSETLLKAIPPEGVPIGPRLVMRRFGTQIGVFAGSMAVVAPFGVTDTVGRRLAIATLANVDAATDTEIATAFGMHRNTVHRLAVKVAQGGVAALIPSPRPAPPPRTKLNDEARSIIASNAAAMAPKDIVAAIATATGIHISVVQVRRLVAAWRQANLFEGDDNDPTPGGGAPVPAGSASEPDEAPAAEPAAPSPAEHATAGAPGGVEPPVFLPARVGGPNLGLALYYPALAVLGLVESARECFALRSAERFGVRAVSLSLLFLFALGDSTVESAKHLSRASFGALVGAGRAPCVKTLRRKLAELVAQQRATSFLNAVSKRFVASGLLDTAYLYVDGHLQAYSGKANLAHHWSTTQRIVTRGLMRYFVGDAQGRPLLFVPKEASGSLAKAMPEVIAAVREVIGDRRFCVIFDRGGYDAGLFAWLKAEGIDFITYQKGDPDLPKESFSRREARFEGKRLRFLVAEDSVMVKGTGPWRRVVVRTTTGHQTPILTSLDPGTGAARIACLMFARWRQENFFRYMRQHLGIDALISYAFGAAPGDEVVPNPERKELDRQIAAKAKELAGLKQALGDALLEAPGRGGGGLRGLLVDQDATLRGVEALEADIELLKTRRWALPKTVALAEAASPKDLADMEAKTIVDAVKITAYNAEGCWSAWRSTTAIPTTSGICSAASSISPGRSPPRQRASPSASTHQTPRPTGGHWRACASS